MAPEITRHTLMHHIAFTGPSILYEVREMLLIGKNFEVMDIIHEGIESIIYRAVRKTDSRLFMIKTVKPNPQINSSIENIRLEFKLLKSLSHISIPKAHNIFDHQHFPAFTMEGINGSPLKKVTGKKLLPLPQLLDIMINILNGFLYLHFNDIIHGRINPSNILLQPVDRSIRIINLQTYPSNMGPLEISPQDTESLPYISPEQTGRTNYPIDKRTDIYSLGITFYELIYGDSPFSQQDGVELIHSLITREPAFPPSKAYPREMSDITCKMLKKKPEERYQSIYGILQDMEKVRKKYHSKKDISIVLFEDDIPMCLDISGIPFCFDDLIHNFNYKLDQSRHGNKQVSIIKGDEGTGKSFLINRFISQLRENSADCLYCRFHSEKQTVPYYGFFEGISQMLKNIISKGRAVQNVYRKMLFNKLHYNIQSLFNVIPELNSFFPKSQISPTSHQSETVSRFQSLIYSLIQSFTEREIPLILIYEDIEYADPSSLDILKSLIEDNNALNLFIIISFCERPLHENPGNYQFLQNLLDKNRNFRILPVHPLSQGDVGEIIQDIFKLCPRKDETLIEILHKKTRGNRKLISRLIREAYGEGHIFFDVFKKCYRYDINGIKKIELEQTQILPKDEDVPYNLIELLKTASCFDHEFNIFSLSYINEIETEIIRKHFENAQGLGLIEKNTDDCKNEYSYSFYNRQIKNYFNQMLTEEEKMNICLRIGNYKYMHQSPDESEISEIVSYYNKGQSLLRDNDLSLRVIKLNLRTALQYKEKYDQNKAIEHLLIAKDLLSSDYSWQKHYDITHKVYRGLAESYHLIAETDIAYDYFSLIINNTENLEDKINSYISIIALHSNNSKFDKAIDTTLEALKLLGMEIKNTSSGMMELIAEEKRINRQLTSNLVIKDLYHNEITSNKLEILKLKIMTEAIAPLYFSNQLLLYLFAIKMTNITLEAGISQYAGISYAIYSATLFNKPRDIDKGHQFAILALKLNHKFNCSGLYAKFQFIFSAFICHWKKHLKVAIYFADQAYLNGLKYGDPNFSSYSLGTKSYNELFLGNIRLEDLLNNISKGLEHLQGRKFDAWFYFQQIIRSTVMSLTGKTKDPLSLSTADHDENTVLESLTEMNFIPGKSIFYFMKGFLHQIYGRFQEAIILFEKTESSMDYLTSTFSFAECRFYYLISLLRYNIDQNTKDPRINKMIEYFEILSKRSEKNFLCRYLLCKSLFFIYSENIDKAMYFLDKAIRQCRNDGFPVVEALCHEIYAMLFFRKGQPKISGYFAKEAISIYEGWGAAAKAEQLLKEYCGSEEKPFIFSFSDINTSKKPVFSKPISKTPFSIDTISLIKASQTISNEIDLKNLVDKLLNILIKTAGAYIGKLIIYQNEKRILYANGMISNNNETITKITEIDENVNLDIPMSVLYHVESTYENLIIDNTAVNTFYKADRYIALYNPASILCIPILLKGSLIAVLYLENRTFSNTFSRDLIKILQVLSTQAAISLKNAIYFDEITRTKENLKKSKESYQTLFENLLDLYYRLDTEGNILMVSPSIKSILGYSSKDAVNLNIANDIYLCPEKHGQFLNHIIQFGSIDNFETQLKKKDGNTIWASINGHLLKDDEGKMTGIEGMIRNIERIKQTEQDLKKEKEKLSLILKSIQDGVIAVDTHFKIILINEFARKYALSGPAKDLGSAVSIINTYTNKSIMPELKNILITKEVMIFDRHLTLNGTDISMIAAPILDDAKNPLGILLVFKDITEKLKMEEELLKSQKLEAISVFAGGIAHDFNNILTAIVGNMTLLKMKTDKESKAYTRLEQIEKASYRAKDLTQQLMTFSKGGDPVKKPCDIKNLLTESATFMLSGSKVKPHFEIQGDLFTIEADINQISQVINNLVINAMHAMPEGGNIFLKAKNITLPEDNAYKLKAGKYAEIQIQDTGTGIPSNILPKIFEPFYTTKKKGNGLGLATSRSIINKHNGHITVKTTPGEGTVFFIYIPASDKRPGFMSMTQETEVGEFSGNALIMDDEEIILTIASQILNTLGLSVVTARDGQEAIDKFMGSEHGFDIVLMDLTIPGKIGAKEAVKEILKIDPKAKVVVSSGYPNDPVMADHRSYGFWGSITKPYTLNDLIRIIKGL